MDNICFVSCATWIKRGASKQKPDKVEVTKEDLAQIIEDTRSKLRDVEMNPTSAAHAGDNADSENGEGDGEESEALPASTADTYNMEHYDEEDDDGEQNVLALGQMAEFASNADDPYVTCADGEESDSESEDLEVRPDENLIVSGLVDGDASTLVFHVFNEDQGSIYVHHDILLSSFPICVEWLSHETGQDAPGSFVAVGSMLPVIEVWDADVINSFEPAYKLGRRAKKKGKREAVGHTDAVLSLAWNHHLGHVLASGSADHTLLLWDLDTLKPANTLHCREKVQTLAWHPHQADQLVSGDCGGDVRLWDCQSEESKRWQLAGEVEQAVWDHFNPVAVVASTDDGQLHYIDTRQEKRPLWSVQAHEDACTGLALSPEVPGCLVTTSADKTLKVWDVASSPAQPVAQQSLRLGSLHCVSFCPDLPWMTCLGGDNKENSFRVWDVRDSDAVRARFGSRPLSRTMRVAESGETMETDDTAAALGVSDQLRPGPSSGARPTAAGKKLKKRHKGKSSHE